MSYPLRDLEAHCRQFPSKHDWLDGDRKIVLYGAGKLGGDVLQALRSRGVPVDAFIDGKKTEPSQHDGVPVYPLHHPETGELSRQGAIVLLTLLNFSTDSADVATHLAEHKFARIVTPMEICDALGDELKGAYYWLAPSSYFLRNKDRFLETEAMWDDAASRDLYRRLLWYRFGRDLSAHPVPRPETQYAPDDLPRWPEKIRLLDGGACEGEALDVLVRSGYQIDQLYAWEPDLANYARLESALNRNYPRLPSILFPCGLGSSTQVLRFASGLGISSVVTEEGDDRVIVLSGDSALRHAAINLIKLDIEGGEAEALAGMRALIERQKPGLAICIYHRWDDLITIPAAIRSWNPDYRLYLRSHAWNTFETVLYAV